MVDEKPDIVKSKINLSETDEKILKSVGSEQMAIRGADCIVIYIPGGRGTGQ